MAFGPLRLSSFLCSFVKRFLFWICFLLKIDINKYIIVITLLISRLIDIKAKKGTRTREIL